jgi:hypothetical protein
MADETCRRNPVQWDVSGVFTGGIQSLEDGLLSPIRREVTEAPPRPVESISDMAATGVK